MAHIFRRRKRPVGASWRKAETYIKVAGQGKCLYRAVVKSGDKVELGSVALATDKRDFGGDDCQFLKQDGFVLPMHKTGQQKTA